MIKFYHVYEDDMGISIPIRKNGHYVYGIEYDSQVQEEEWAYVDEFLSDPIYWEHENIVGAFELKQHGLLTSLFRFILDGTNE